MLVVLGPLIIRELLANLHFLFDIADEFIRDSRSAFAKV